MDPMLKLLREFINQTGFAVQQRKSAVNYTVWLHHLPIPMGKKGVFYLFL